MKAFGIKGAVSIRCSLLMWRRLLTSVRPQPKITIALLDQDDLRPLAHLMNSYPSVLKEKALLVQAAQQSK